MRVLKGKVLVSVTIKSGSNSELINTNDHIREGDVYISGSDQVEVGNRILFGNKFEDVKIDCKEDTKCLLMDEENIKIIFDDDDPKADNNILPFMKRAA